MDHIVILSVVNPHHGYIFPPRSFWGSFCMWVVFLLQIHSGIFDISKLLSIWSASLSWMEVNLLKPESMYVIKAWRFSSWYFSVLLWGIAGVLSSQGLLCVFEILLFYYLFIQAFCYVLSFPIFYSKNVVYYYISVFYILNLLRFYFLVSYGSIYSSKIISGFPLHLLSLFLLLERILWVVMKYFAVSKEFCSFFVSSYTLGFYLEIQLFFNYRGLIN